MTTPLNGSVLKAFRILNAFDRPGATRTAAEISAALDLNIASVHRFLLTLESVNAVYRCGSGRFQLGGALIDLGNRVELHDFLAATVQPEVSDLVDKFQEIAHVTVLENDEVVYIAKGASSRSLSIQTHVGKRLPAYCTGVGKALLAYLPENELDRYLAEVERVLFTDRTITDEGELREELLKIRGGGFAVDFGEMENGLKCVAVPIFDRRGDCIAAISVSAPETRFPDEKVPEIQKTLKKKSQQITANLGLESGREVS